MIKVEYEEKLVKKLSLKTSLYCTRVGLIALAAFLPFTIACFAIQHEKLTKLYIFGIIMAVIEALLLAYTIFDFVKVYKKIINDYNNENKLVLYDTKDDMLIIVKGENDIKTIKYDFITTYKVFKNMIVLCISESEMIAIPRSDEAIHLFEELEKKSLEIKQAELDALEKEKNEAQKLENTQEETTTVVEE